MLDSEWTPLFDVSEDCGDKSNELGVREGYRPLAVGLVRTYGRPIVSEEGTAVEFGPNPSSSNRYI